MSAPAHDRPLNILLYNEAFAPSIGGVETVVALLARDLAERGEHVVVVTRTPSGETDAPTGDTFRVVRQPTPRALQRLVRDADLVHMHSFDARVFLTAKCWRRRVVTTYHDLTPICAKATKLEPTGPCLHPAAPRVCTRCLRASGQPRPLRKLLRPPVKAALSLLMDANVCVSDFAQRRYPLWRAQRIACGVDTQLLRPADTQLLRPADTQLLRPADTQLLRPADTRPHPASNAAPEAPPARVAFVGRLVPEKGCDVLLRAMQRCSDAGAHFDLDIVGDGPEREALAALARAEGLADRVHFHGARTPAGVVEFLHAACVAVVPSLWDEPFGLTALEAFSCGVPVVAADVGGLGELVADVGLRFARGDDRQLAARLEELLSDAALRAHLAERGRRAAETHYDHRAMGAAYLALYRRLVHA